MKGYLPIENHQIALKSAQAWTATEFGSDYNYIYKISETEKGYYVTVVLSDDPETNQQTFPGGHFALYIDNSGKVYDVFRGA